MTANKQTHIGTLAEKSLHASLKTWYAQPGDQFEVKVENFVIDIVRGEQLIEIQTRNFSALKRKLPKLLDKHRVHLLYPISQDKWIVRQTEAGEPLQRRKSPKRGQLCDVFRELVYIPHLIAHPNFSIEILLIQSEEIWRDDGLGSWRRKRWSVYDQRLLQVVEQVTFQGVTDWEALLPPDLPQPFTTRDLTSYLHLRSGLAQKMSYALRKMAAITVVGKQGNTLLLAQDRAKS